MAAVTLSGVNGIDFNTILNAVMQAEGQPLQAIQDQQKKIQDKDAAFVSLAGFVTAIQTPVTSLTSETAFSNVAAVSTDTSIATVSLGDGGIVGQYDVSITALAKGQVTKSTNGYTATSDTAATGGSISFTINGSTTTAITITSATTLADLKTQINNQNSGVVASIVNDGTNYKLVISSRETGTTNGFTINNSLTSSGTAVAFASGQNSSSGNTQNAQNAALTVNGISIASASNTVANAVPGVTVTLLKAGDMSVKVTKDFSTIKDNLKTIVAQYNKLRHFYNQQTSEGVLGTDSVLREVVSDIKKVLLTSNSNGGRYHYASEIGLEFTTTGDLKLDETKLNTAIDSYSTDLQKLFQGTTGVDGVLDTLKSTLSSLDGTAGLIKTTRNSIDTSLKGYRDRIDQQQLRLDIRRQELIKQYTAADQAMSRQKQMTSSLSNLQSGSLF